MIDIIFNNLDNPIGLVLALVAFLAAIYFAIIPHEIAHALVAKWNGDDTAKNMGRLSMNPLAHLDIVGFIMLLLVGFGYAKPVPVNPNNFSNPRKGMFLVSIAGVTYNIIASFVSYFFCALLLFFQLNFWTLSSDLAVYTFSFFYSFFLTSSKINILLFLFNILPIGALDGLKILASFTRPGNTVVNFLYRYGNYILMMLIILHIATDKFAEYEIVQYFDLLGLYIYNVTNYIFGFYSWLFGLIFGFGA